MAEKSKAIRKELTPKFIDALHADPNGKRYIVYDEIKPHLGVRVTTNGVKSFVVYKRPAGADCQ